jgi:hypothetical protein
MVDQLWFSKTIRKTFLTEFTCAAAGQTETQTEATGWPADDSSHRTSTQYGMMRR